MKTSSKLLIGLALATLLIPICTISYMYLAKGANIKEYEGLIKEEANSLTVADTYLETTKLPRFDKVILRGANYLFINVYHIKSQEYAIKIGKDKAEYFTSTLDPDNTLKIEWKQSKGFYTASIYLFAPDLDDLHIGNAQIGKLETDVDSLNLFVGETRNNINFGKNDKLTYLNISIRESNLHLDGSRKNLPNLNTLQLNLDNSSILLREGSYNRVIVNAENSRFSLNGGKSNKFEFDDLQLLMNGKSSVSFGEVETQINKLTGQLSDSTRVDLPLYQTRILLSESY